MTGDLCMQLRAGAIGLAEAVMPEKYSKDTQRRKKAPEDVARSAWGIVYIGLVWSLSAR